MRNNVRGWFLPWAASPYPWKRARCSHHVNQPDFHWLQDCVPIYTTGGWKLLCFCLFLCLKLPLVVFLYLDIIQVLALSNIVLNIRRLLHLGWQLGEGARVVRLL